MSSVGQTGDNSVNVSGLDQKQVLNPVDFFDEHVKRGYDGKISQSHNDILLEEKIPNTHRLTRPKVESFDVNDLRKMQEILLKSEESIAQSNDIKNIAKLNFEDDLSPEANKIKNDLKIMQGVKELENMLGHKLEESKKNELLKFMAESATLSKLSETEDIKSSEIENKKTSSSLVEKDKIDKQNNKTTESKEIKKQVDGNNDTDKIWDDIWLYINGNTSDDEAINFSTEEKKQLAQAQNNFNLVFDKNGYADISVKVGAIIDGPKKLIGEIKSDFSKLTRLMSGDGQLWDTDEITTILSGIQQKMQDNRLKFDQETIKIGQVEREQVSKETINKLREQIKKDEEARNASWISRIFGFIALAVMAVATAAAFATGVGAVAGAALIAAMAMMVVMTVDQEMGGSLIMKPLAQSIMNTFGIDEQTANWIATAIIMAITIALSLGGSAAATATKAASKAAIMTTRATMVAGGATSVGEGAAGIVSGVKKYEAEQLKADAKELNAKMLRIQKLIDDATESIAQALEELQSGHSNIAEIIANNDDTKKRIGRNIKGS